MSVEQIGALTLLLVAVVGAIGAAVAAALNGRVIRRQGKETGDRLDHIDGMVNGRLDKALMEIEYLKARLRVLTEEKGLREG